MAEWQSPIERELAAAYGEAPVDGQSADLVRGSSAVAQPESHSPVQPGGSPRPARPRRQSTPTPKDPGSAPGHEPRQRRPRPAPAAQGVTGASPSTSQPAKKGRADHLKPHAFQKGQSGNPGGRPKGLVRKIRELTDDGVVLAVFMHQVFLGEIVPSDPQMRAATWLAEHGFGRPQPLEMPPLVDRPPMVFMFTRPPGYDPLSDPTRKLGSGGMAATLPPGQTKEEIEGGVVVLPGIGPVKDLEAVSGDV